MSHSRAPRTQYELNRREFLQTAAVAGAGLLAAGPARGKPAPAKAGDATMTYVLVNKTGGKFTDDQVFWTLNGKDFKSLADAPTVTVGKKPGGRVYFSLGQPMKDMAGRGVYFDFIEYTFNDSGWHGNTTQVDAFGIPLTIELVDRDGTSKSAGITESRAALFDAFKKDLPKEFQSCIKDPFRIVSPCQADFGKGAANGNYFDAYINEVWDAYAKETKTPGGWTGKVVDGGLVFTPPAGGKPLVCPRKPTTQDAFLGTGVLGQLPQFCAAINRHVLADPADWKEPTKYYKASPANFYAKFWHDHSINGKAYGFCYDDVNAQDTLIESRNPVKLVVTLYWDAAPTPKPAG